MCIVYCIVYFKTIPRALTPTKKAAAVISRPARNTEEYPFDITSPCVGIYFILFYFGTCNSNQIKSVLYFQMKVELYNIYTYTSNVYNSNGKGESRSILLINNFPPVSK